MKDLEEVLKKEVMGYTIMIIENLIKELEAQGKDYVTTTTLRKFLHNLETDTKVVGKKYVSEFGEHGN